MRAATWLTHWDVARSNVMRRPARAWQPRRHFSRSGTLTIRYAVGIRGIAPLWFVMSRQLGCNESGNIPNFEGRPMNHFSNKLIRVTAIVMLAAVAGTATAQTPWQKNHPRRTQVNSRLAHQNKRIHQDVKNGTMSKGQAAAAHKDDRQIRHEERDTASQNGSHITGSEQKVLNQQENGVSKDIPPK
jgi:hypothetical protein